MLKRFIKWLKYHLSHQWCYDRMEKGEQSRNDLISRKALLERLSNMQPVGFAQSVAGMVALKEIENAPAVIAKEATHGQWIPFTDPPKRMKTVICLYKDENGTQAGGGYVNDHGIWTLIAPAKGTITHWMHMPELPKPLKEG